MTVAGAGPEAPASSRTSARAAGWTCDQPAERPVLLGRTRRLSWFNPRTLWVSRNDLLARLADPVGETRAAYVGDRTDDDLVLDVADGPVSFLVLGDTGEGDWSQYAVRAPLLSQAPGTAFLVICSDVIYPVGDVNDWQRKFYAPYRDYPGPILGVPGNHDWYDDLQGFLWHLCGRRSFPGRARVPDGWRAALTTRRGWSRLLWRSPRPADERTLADEAAARHRPPTGQPGPYYVLDTPHLRLVAVDTGIRGRLDGAQGDWLVRMSRDPRPKVLLTGRPLWVDGSAQATPIDGGEEGFADVDAVVREPAHGYVAVLAGDTHNYQRYPVDVGGRVVQHVVSGGGGAFMHATHSIPSLDGAGVPGVREADFHCYPLRRDSLAAYSRLLDRRLRPLLRRPWLALTPDEAAGYLRERLDVEPLPSRPVHGGLSARARAAAVAVFLVRGSKRFHGWFSPFLDWDEPPFFKQFLRVDVSAEELRIRCFAVTGCPEHDSCPPVEDDVRIPLAATGRPGPRSAAARPPGRPGSGSRPPAPAST